MLERMKTKPKSGPPTKKMPAGRKPTAAASSTANPATKSRTKKASA